jgi:hypothetical protein
MSADPTNEHFDPSIPSFHDVRGRTYSVNKSSTSLRDAISRDTITDEQAEREAAKT